MLFLPYILAVTPITSAQQCGPLGSSGPAVALKCSPDLCCSQYGWCGTTFDYCDPTSCQPVFSGDDSACSSSSSLLPVSSSPSLASSTVAPSPPPGVAPSAAPFQSAIPDIETCGSISNASCPGAGNNAYYYRCCSAYGHCGPKNPLQNPSDYCGAGCQTAWGNCEANLAMPPDPSASPTIVYGGDACGPIVNQRCAEPLCCSGSNYCGTGEEYCGEANWCQGRYGRCDYP